MAEELNELYAKKGQLITTQEILQNQLNEINQGFNQELNKATPPPVKEAESEEKTDAPEKEQQD